PPARSCRWGGMQAFPVFSVAGCLALGAVALACGGGADATPDPTRPPAGCARTMCDLERATCTNAPPPRDYCSECISTCSSPYVATFADGCFANCRTICAAAPSTPPVDDCAAALDACHKTRTNAICTDGVEARSPDGTPCGDAASRASCAAEGDLLA